MPSDTNVVESAVAEGASALYSPLVQMVMHYLFPEPKDWITEWTGPHGYHVIRDAFTDAGRQVNLPLTDDQVGVVMEYLKKSDVFGLSTIQKHTGQSQELAKLFRNRNGAASVPIDIDDEMQADLSSKFDTELLRPFPSIKKMTELYSLYLCPAGMTITLAGALGCAKIPGAHSLPTLSAVREHRNKSTQGDCWIQFPNALFARGKTIQEQAAFIPPNFDFPQILDVVFCAFVKFLCTGELLLSGYPPTFTFCLEKSNRCPVVVGAFGPKASLQAHICYTKSDADYGVAAVRKHFTTQNC